MYVIDILANLFGIRKKCCSSGRRYTNFYRKLLNFVNFSGVLMSLTAHKMLCIILFSRVILWAVTMIWDQKCGWGLCRSSAEQIFCIH